MTLSPGPDPIQRQRQKATAVRTLLFCLFSMMISLTLFQAASAQGDSAETDNSSWKILGSHSEVEFTGGEVFSLGVSLFVDARGRLWDTWDTSLTLTEYHLDVINSQREKISEVRFTDIAYSDDSSGFICGEQGVLLQTKDYGRNWKQRYFENLDFLYFYGLEFSDRRNGTLIGVTGSDSVRLKGIIYQTYDAGQTWTQLSDVPGMGFSHISWDEQSKNLIITALGAFLISENKGTSWKYIEIPDGPLMRATILENDKGLSVGTGGRMLSSADGGKSWQEEQSPTKRDLHCLFAYQPNWWYMAGEAGEIWETRDAGAAWTKIQTPKKVRINGIKRLGPLLFAWGTDGTIMVKRL